MNLTKNDYFNQSDYFILEIISINNIFQNELDKMEEYEGLENTFKKL